MWDEGADADGWWLGWCPVHGHPNGDIEEPSAQFNFQHGSLRCMGNPDNAMMLSCHTPSRAMSLQNALLRMARRG